MEEEEDERTLLVVREVSVFKIPHRSTSGGYRCGEWLESDKIWAGRLRLVASGAKCVIRLEDSNTGDLFAACPVEAGKREASVESALDSSRYFVLKVDDGRGRHAFIGLGFSERNDAFDFNVALSDHEKYVKRDDALDDLHQHQSAAPPQALDLRLKEGETMKINVKTRGPSAGGMMKTATTSTGNSVRLMAPPPGGARIRSPLPPPPDTSKSTHATPSNASTSANTMDALSDLSQLQASLPPPSSNSSLRSSNNGSNNSSSNRSGAGAGWAAF